MYMNYNTVLSLQSRLANLTRLLHHVNSYQQFFEVRESRHWQSLVAKNNRVFWWSLVNCAIMLTVSVLQVLLIKRLFRKKREDRITT